jgi:hypothetical protein
MDQSGKDKKKRKQYWSDIDIVSTADGSASKKMDIKEEKLEGSQNQAVAAKCLVPAVLSEGSVNPVEDLEKILAAYETAKLDGAANVMEVQNVVTESLHTMERIIELLVLTGATSAHYRKAVACLSKLRQACLVDQYASAMERFNNYLRDNVKNKFKVGRHNVFWKNVVSAEISLIHSDETNGVVAVTAEESRQFLQENEVKVVVEAAEVKQEEEEDDMFGDMA